MRSFPKILSLILLICLTSQRRLFQTFEINLDSRWMNAISKSWTVSMTLSTLNMSSLWRNLLRGCLGNWRSQSLKWGDQKIRNFSRLLIQFLIWRNYRNTASIQCSFFTNWPASCSRLRIWPSSQVSSRLSVRNGPISLVWAKSNRKKNSNFQRQ